MAAEKVKKITTGYVPRPLQAKLHASLKRFNVLVCHRRFGKTVFSINDMIDRGLRNPLENPQYAYIAPNYGQAKRVAWEILKKYTKDIPGFEANEAELRVDIYRAKDRLRFMLLGAENPRSLHGIYLDGGIMDEFADCDPTVWTSAVRPTLTDRLGWVTFIGTPKGQNHFHKVLQTAQADQENWFYAIYRASETGIIPQSELDLAKSTMSDEEYMQEFECSFTAALIGSYYGKYIEAATKENRITDVPYDPALPVRTYWDLGIGDTTCIWFMQQFGMTHRAIDYYEMSGMGLEHYVKVLREKPYAYEEHILPHDAAARDLSTGRSRQETLRSLGLSRTRILERHSVEDGINAARVLFPKTWFDKTKCARGIEALTNYEKKWDAKNQIFSDKPLHNWASNGADAFRTFAMGVREDFGRPDMSKLPQEADRDYDIFGG